MKVLRARSCQESDFFRMEDWFLGVLILVHFAMHCSRMVCSASKYVTRYVVI